MEPTKMPVEDALHAVFTRHGIASRSDLPHGLISDLIHWAAAECRYATKDKLLALLRSTDAAINPADRDGISLHEWNGRLKTATERIRAAIVEAEAK